MVKHFFANLSKHTNVDYDVRIKDAAAEALKCMSFAHCMEEFAHARVHKRCDLTMVLKEIAMKGLNDSELKSGCLATCSGKKLHLIVEVVSAVRLENCFQRDYNYFAPRFAHIGSVDREKHEANFEGEFVFEDFYVPPGSEDSTYVCLTIGVADVMYGQVHLPFMSAGWTPLPEGDNAGIEARPSAEVFFFKDAVKNAHKEAVTCSVRLMCPVPTGGRRCSQINRIVSEDLKAKGGLHHSGALSPDQLEKRDAMDPNNELKARGSTLNRLMNDAGKQGGGEPQDEDAQTITQLEGDLKLIKEEIAILKNRG